ncbi:FecR family protein [Sphingobacterium lumbrici]|uniref:FecR family protein n=1 Tax=Sphingobacterium lumbrici TaxID=2559600 RepID=UPI0015E448C7|nr:FecR family protein [Sphingobacterium lumbrici]
MKDKKDLFSNYIAREENLAERKEIYDWYDEQKQPLPNEASIRELEIRAKKRVFTSIRAAAVPKNTKRLLQAIAAAASISLVALMGYLYWAQKPAVLPADEQRLAQVLPGKQQAIITLPDGQVIAADDLKANESLEIGSFTITKDQNGQITYHSKHIAHVKDQMHTMQTPQAATYDLILSDGTKVRLNEQSKLTYPVAFGDGDRIVYLEGEAYFQVTKSSSSSRFIVKTARQETEVLGTKFNIKAYQKDKMIYTTLEEGSVQVQPENRRLGGVLLHPRQQAVLTEQQIRTAIVDLEVVLGWTKDLFCFDGTNTEEVLGQIARWYNIDITYEKNNRGTRYSGKIPKNLPLDQLVKLLRYADLTVNPTLNDDNRVNLIIN